MDSDIVWDIAEGIVIFMPQATCRADLRVDVLCSIDNAVVKGLPVFLRGNAFEDGIGYY